MFALAVVVLVALFGLSDALAGKCQVPGEKSKCKAEGIPIFKGSTEASATPLGVFRLKELCHF
jgi:hypothetical protein